MKYGVIGAFIVGAFFGMSLLVSCDIPEVKKALAEDQIQSGEFGVECFLDGELKQIDAVRVEAQQFGYYTVYPKYESNRLRLPVSKCFVSKAEEVSISTNTGRFAIACSVEGHKKDYTAIAVNAQTGGYYTVVPDRDSRVTYRVPIDSCIVTEFDYDSELP